MFKTFKTLLTNKSGVTAIEYGLIAALVAVAAVTALQLVGSKLATTFTAIAGHL